MLIFVDCIGVSITLVFDALVLLFFKQKTAYEVRISDWSSDVCSSDLSAGAEHLRAVDAGPGARVRHRLRHHPAHPHPLPDRRRGGQIGRASCRARVRQYVSISVVAASL